MCSSRGGGGGGGSAVMQNMQMVMQMVQFQQQMAMQEKAMADAKENSKKMTDQYQDMLDKQNETPASFSPSDSQSDSKAAANLGTKRFLIPVPKSGVNTQGGGLAGMSIPVS